MFITKAPLSREKGVLISEHCAENRANVGAAFEPARKNGAGTKPYSAKTHEHNRVIGLVQQRLKASPKGTACEFLSREKL